MMGHDIRMPCQSETKKLLCLVAVMFAGVLAFQYLELPDGTVFTFIFSPQKAPVVLGEVSRGDSSAKSDIVNMSTVASSQNMNSANVSAFHGIAANNTEKNTSMEEKDIGKRNDTITSFGEATSNPSSTDNNVSLKKSPNKPETNVKLENVNNLDGGFSPPNLVVPLEAAAALSMKNGSIGDGSSVAHTPDVSDTATLKNSGRFNDYFAAPAPAVPPTISSSDINFRTISDAQSVPPAPKPQTVSVEIAPTGVEEYVTHALDGKEEHRPVDGKFTGSNNNACVKSMSSANEKSQLPKEAVVSLYEMNKLLLQSRASSCSVRRPQWSSSVDKELLDAKSQIENSPILRNDGELYAPLYQNVSRFKRSYELMEQKLKVYIYREGEKPIFHTTVLQGIYASEGWFMKLMEANKQFVTRNPKKAHLFYLPFSSRLLEETLYIKNSHSFDILIDYLKNYLNIIVARYPHWNRTSGADHFLVACHDWAPVETKEYMAQCIRALCNADVKEGFQLGKDVSLPETYVRDPKNTLRELGGTRPSRKKNLAFFAGNMHGSVRPILLKYWENKDPDMKIFGLMGGKKGKAEYIQGMKNSKYCICAKGYEVNSPRVVEAIFFECVPVIISDNFVPPLFEILNWESFAVFVAEKDIPNLKNILLSIPEKRYLQMQLRVKKVQQHFLWHARPIKYDLFHMILHSIWYNRVFGVRL